MCCIGDIRFWILNWVCVELEILDFSFGSSKWILATIEFLYWVAAIRCCHFFKKTGTYQRGCRGNRTGMCQFLYIFAPSVPFFNSISEEPRWYVILSITVVQPHLYLQYFLSRLYNRACKPYTTVIKCLFSTSVIHFFNINLWMFESQNVLN